MLGQLKSSLCPSKKQRKTLDWVRAGKCPVCLFVFCLECKKASHGTADCIGHPQDSAIVREISGKEKEEEENEKNKDCEVFEAMLRKSGPKRCYASKTTKD